MYGGTPYGHLHGTIYNNDGSITGDDISYIYPDMETALLGSFKNRLMKDALESTVLDVSCDENGLLYVSEYAKPATSSPRFYYEQSSNISFGGGPKGVPDPYEKKWLEVRECDDPNMEEGLFAKADLKKGIIISSYSGFNFHLNNGEQEIYVKSCSQNKTKTIKERQHCNKYTIALPEREARIDIPPEHDQPGSFIPSWGPKVYRLYINCEPCVHHVLIKLYFNITLI